MPDALRAQWERAPELLAAFDWTVAATPDLEADDLLWSFSRREADAGGRTLVCSADRDLYQTVADHTAVIELRRDSQPGTIDAAGVRERSGVAPEQIPDLIALRGDPSDGLPGARGIGAKTAAQLLQDHATLEGVIAAAPTLRPRIAAALTEQADELRMFKDIATLRQIEVPHPPDAPTNRTKGADAAEHLGMANLAARLRS
jgi:DNA polymerase-1